MPFTRSLSQTSHPLALIHCDLWGPSPVSSLCGFKYYISFVDDYTRLTYIYPLKFKSEALSAFQQYKTLIENKFDRKIKTLQSDWGGEFRSFTSPLQNYGIEFRHSCPHTSQQNGIVERKHRHIVEIGLTFLAQAAMPLHFWWEAFCSAVYVVNRLPTPVLHNLSPWEKAFQRKPDFEFLRVFGCTCFPCLRPYQPHKFDYHSSKCVFLGYSPVHKGYKCLSASGRVFISWL